MSCRTPRVLDSASSLITIMEDTSVIHCKLFTMSNLQEDQPTNRTEKKSGKQPHSPQTVGLSNWC
jgi:hypothetical protein